MRNANRPKSPRMRYSAMVGEVESDLESVP